MFIKQDPMRRVVYSLIPILLWSVFLYGWRVLALTGFVFILGIMSEFIFEKSRNKKVSEAVLVSCALFVLSLPPGVPFWVAGVGIVFAVVFGKEVFGGFGRNVFNPAITGRTFIYISFPILMQTTWMIPGGFGTAGINRLALGSTWLEAVVMLLLACGVFFLALKNVGKTKILVGTIGAALAILIAFYVVSAYGGFRTTQKPWMDVDVVAMATPLEIEKGLADGDKWQPAPDQAYLKDNSLVSLFFGFRVGAIGEGSIFLILIAAVYLLITKTAQWRLMISTVFSALILVAVLYFTSSLADRFPHLSPLSKSGVEQLSDILRFMMEGSLLFAAVFMSTDPVSAPKKPLAQIVYGIIIGGLTITIRAFAGFPEGVSFAILTANVFASLVDEIMPARKKKAAAVGGTSA